jgi:hypothetical protein
MFGLDFLFATALFALPLAGVPVLLHLLFRKKSPVVQFSTVRFIKSSLQRTAARRRVQRWLLLACRALLLLLLIWAIAQPAHRVAANWLGGAKSPIAAVVLDTSYSMLLKDQETPLLDRADAAVQSLLRDELRGARVAVFRSTPPPVDQPETLVDAGELSANWSPAQPTPAPVPLAERIASAVTLLAAQDADQKWLFVLSDFQSREFPRPVSPPADMRTVLIDLHANDARDAGVSKFELRPERPIPGVGAEAVVSVAGRPGESRAVTLRAADVAGKVSAESTLVATLDRAGKASLRFPLKLPADRWQTLTAGLPPGDPSPWNDARTQLLEVPPRRVVSLLTAEPAPPAARFVRLALDPSEGAQTAWPLLVKPSTNGQIAPEAKVVVAVVSKWPDADRARQWLAFARGGGTVILILQPGLEESFATMPKDTTDALRELLAGTPVKRSVSGEYATLTGPAAATMEGLVDPAMNLSAATARRFVPLDDLPAATQVILALSRTSGAGAERPVPLLARRAVGAGAAFTLTTLPDPRYTNLGTHPVFLPTLVRAALTGTGGSTPANVEIGSPIVLRDRLLENVPSLNLENPRQERFVVPATRDDRGVSFTFTDTGTVGVYTITRDGRPEPIALANVQPPGGETDADHRDAREVASGQNVVVARSVEELQSKFATLSEPEPRWSLPIAIVLVLLCFESLMGSVTTAWRWPFRRPS